MKGKIIGWLMLLLFITSVLSGVFIAKPVVARYGENVLANSSSEASNSAIASPNISLNDQGKNSILQGENVQTPQTNDAWDFSNFTKWNSMAYMSGNKTRLIVGVNSSNTNSITQLESIASRSQAVVVNQIKIGGNVSALVVEIEFESMLAFVQDVREMGLASYVEPNMKVQVQFTPNDPYWNLQWGPQKIQADWAWNTTKGSSSVLVAVVDTGIDYTHPDLKTDYVPLGYNWVYNNADPLDDFGHGTHCAGIIAAVLNNNVGIAGIAQVHIMAEKVLDSGGYGYWDWVTEGIVHATDQGANIISMSLGGYGDSELVHIAVKYANDAGVLLIAAAGNDNTDMKSYPAAYEEVVAVAATDQFDDKASFSNYGDWIELAAPGVGIYSTMPTYPVTLNYYGYSMNYDYLSGTSMACPCVAGVAALAWSRYPNSTSEFVRQWLRVTADDLGDPGFDQYYGFGRVDARKTVEMSPPAHDLVASEWKTPPYVKLGKTATITATVLNFGTSDETNVDLEILANGTLANSIQIGFLPSGTKATISLAWNVAVEGFYNLTLYVMPVPGETNLDNNVLTKNVYAGSPIIAEVLHSYGNILSESIINWQALTNNWHDFGNMMVYIDYTTLNKEGITYEDIAATQADVLIISCAAIPYYGFEFTDSEIEAITRYVHEGHGLIATAGTLYEGVPNNNKLGPLFGLNESISWTATYTDLLHLLNATHPVFTNVPNPLVFPQVATNIPYSGRWDSSNLIGGKYLALGHYQESAIVTYRGLVYISPWLEIIPPYYHHHLQLLYNAIVWSNYQKPAHELVTHLQAPMYLQPGESTLLNATVENEGLSNETNVELDLMIDSTTVDSTLIPELATGSTYQINYQWTPTQERIYNISAYSPPVLGEDNFINNLDSVLLHVRPTRYVLFDSSHDTDGDSLAGNYRFLDELLISNGFVVDELTNGPITSQTLSKYDILVLMDPELDFSPSEITDIQNWVLCGGGLFAIPDGGYPGTMNLLLSPYSVTLTGWNGGYGTTSYIANHTITQGVTQIFVDLVQQITTASPSTSLAWIDGLGFMSASADGDVVVLSDSNVMDNDGLGMADNARLMLNIFNWIGIKPEHDLGVQLDVPSYMEPNASAYLGAKVYNRGINNESNVQVEMQINGSVVDSLIIPELLVQGTYTFSFWWTPPENELYNVTVFVQPVSDEIDVSNNVATKYILVRPLKYVLFDQTHGTDWIGDYNIWTQNLAAGGYIVDSLYNSPITLATLEKYNVFVIPRAYFYYASDELSAIQSFVLNGGGLLVLGDDNPSIYTDLTGFAGITWAYGGVGGVTQDITPHPITAGVNSVYFSAPASILYLNGTAQSLVRDLASNNMLAVSEQTSGKVAGFADGSTLWDSSITQADNLLLADHLIDWLSTPIQVGHELKVGMALPSSLELNSQTSVNMTVENRGMNDETNVGLYLLINDTVFYNMIIPNLQTGETFATSFDWTPGRPGVYNVTVYSPPVTGENNIANNVESKWTSVFYVRSYVPHEPVGNGTAMNWHADDGSWSYTLPFDFPFYGVPYNTIYISSNGLITFLGPDADSVHSMIALSQKLAIAAGWYDWETFSPYDIYIWQKGTCVGICWHVQAIGAGTVGTFEAVLSSEGLIQLDFEHIEGHPSLTVGISNGAGHVLAEDLSYADYANTILFMPFSGERDVAVTSVVPSTNSAPAGNPVDVGVVVENKGNFTENFDVTAYATLQNSSGTSSLMTQTRVYLDPSDYAFSSSSVSAGYLFNVTARVEAVSNLVTWQVGLYFDGNLLTVHRWFEPTWDPEYVFANQSTLTASDIGHGYIIAGAALTNQQNSFSGSGKLCIIEFEVAAVPPAGITYSTVLNVNNTDTFLLDVNNVEMASLKEDGHYEIQGESVLGQYTVGTSSVISLKPGEKRTLTFTWNTSGVAPGDYTIWAQATTVPGETNAQDNTCSDGTVTVTKGATLVHDIAVTNMTDPPSFVYHNWVLKMNVTVVNFGNATESFTVTLYCNTTAIATKPVMNLGPNITSMLYFDCNTSSIPIGYNYTLTAVASTVVGETNVTNNVFIAGKMDVRPIGDINGDGLVNLRDVLFAAHIFRSHPGRADWNPGADVNHDGIVDMRDIVLIVMNFRQQN